MTQRDEFDEIESHGEIGTVIQMPLNAADLRRRCLREMLDQVDRQMAVWAINNEYAVDVGMDGLAEAACGLWVHLAAIRRRLEAEILLLTPAAGSA